MPCERKHVEAMLEAVRTYFQHTSAPDTNFMAVEMFVACDAALAACDESPWRSVESAPKDGTAIIIAGGPALSRWSDVSWWRDGRWCSNDDSYFVNEAITHWMPLPAAPEGV